MASAIDATKPVQGNPTTQSVRENFAAAKSEIELLQQTAGVGPQGPIGNTGPAGTITIGTVTTGPAGGSAAVTNTGTAQAATLNFTLPRGDSGTGGAGITEAQAQDAVRQGQVRFEEATVTNAASWPTAAVNNIATTAPVLGANWALGTGSGGTGGYDHTAGSTEPLAYPITIANGEWLQIIFTSTDTRSPLPQWDQRFDLYFRTAPTTTANQQALTLTGYQQGLNVGTLVVQVAATGAFTHLVVIPVSAWEGRFTLTRIVRPTGGRNSLNFNLKDFPVVVRGTSLAIGGGGTWLSSDSGNSCAIGRDALLRASSGPNVALGHQSLSSTSAGASNVAVGSTALQHMNTGSNNVGVGQNAGYSGFLGGSNNVFIGSQTGPYRGAGDTHDNVFVGYAAGASLATGGQNVILGARAAAIWGEPGRYRFHEDVIIGNDCMRYVSSDSLRVAVVGAYALYRAVGNENVALGHNAGRYLSNGTTELTAADNSVFIGTGTRSSATSQTNQIVIGVHAIGHGSNTITLGNDAITALHCNVSTISLLSDERVKEQIQPANLDMCLDAVKNLPVHRWGWQPIAGVQRDKHVTGFLADEVAKIFPKAVTSQNEYLTKRGADGQPVLKDVSEVVTDTQPDPDGSWERARKTTHTETRQVAETVLIPDLKRFTPTELLPTLWGAVQRLIEKNEELEKQLKELGNGTPPANNAPPANHKSADTKSKKGGRT